MIDYLGLFLLSGLAGFALGRLYFAIRDGQGAFCSRRSWRGHIKSTESHAYGKLSRRLGIDDREADW